MEEKTYLTHDGVSLRYYTIGSDRRAPVVVITSAPGMSIKFWLPIITALQGKYAVLGFDYRGFPKEFGHKLTAGDARFDNLVEDLNMILEKENIEEAHFLSWCSGAKVMLAFYASYPEKFRSITMLNPAHKTGGGAEKSEFSNVLYGLIDKVGSDERSIERVLKLMKNIGVVPNADFFDYIKEDESGVAHALDLADLLIDESSYSNLAFYMIDDAITLSNYLKIYEEINKTNVEESFFGLSVATLLLMGEQDTISYLTERDRDYIVANESISWKEIPGGSHFMLIEYPTQIATEIDRHIETILDQ